MLLSLGLPSELDFDVERVIAAMRHDKKLSGSDISVTYVNEIGKFELVKLSAEEFFGRVRKAFEK